LRNLGVQPNTLVAVVMEKGWEQVVGVMGILQAGGAWLPLSPDMPRDQLWRLLENAKVNLVLTQSPLAAKLEWPQSTPCIPVDYYELNEAPAMPLEQVQKPADLAYMRYIQEPAGTFKEIMTGHQKAVSTIADISRHLGIDHRDRVFSISPFIADQWAYTIFGTLAVGGTLVMPGPDSWQVPSRWEHQLNETQATVWCSGDQPGGIRK
jgi:non-ribosomal peptide synthetase component F